MPPRKKHAFWRRASRAPGRQRATVAGAALRTAARRHEASGHVSGRRLASGEPWKRVLRRANSEAEARKIFAQAEAALDTCSSTTGHLLAVRWSDSPSAQFRRAETRLMSIDYDGALDGDWEPAALIPRVYFRDAAGKRWIRDALGRLRVDYEWGDDDFFRNGGVLLPSS